MKRFFHCAVAISVFLEKRQLVLEVECLGRVDGVVLVLITLKLHPRERMCWTPVIIIGKVTDIQVRECIDVRQIIVFTSI
jgi:hypothetical protein